MGAFRLSLLFLLLFVFTQPTAGQDGGIGLSVVTYGKPTGGEATAYYGASLTDHLWVGTQGTVGFGYQLRYFSLEAPLLVYPFSTERRVAPYAGVSQGVLWSEGRTDYYLNIPLGVEIMLNRRWVLSVEGFYDVFPDPAAGLRTSIVYTF